MNENLRATTAGETGVAHPSAMGNGGRARCMMEGMEHLHDRGLQYDLSTLWQRRRVLGLFGAAGLAGLVGACTSTPAPSESAPEQAGCVEIPAETGGPFPADGTNGPNVLTQSGIVRSDIRSSFGSASGAAGGVPLTINLTVLDTGRGCAALAGAAVYVWQCDAQGRYSLYSPGATGQNYLRGVQQANSAGAVTFQSIFPAAYSGRWPHVHFEVYPSLAAATAASNKVTTSQLALPEEVCEAVYASGGYGASLESMSRNTLQNDVVFRDGWRSQLATVTGDPTTGYVASLTVPV